MGFVESNGRTEHDRTYPLSQKQLCSKVLSCKVLLCFYLTYNIHHLLVMWLVDERVPCSTNCVCMCVSMAYEQMLLRWSLIIYKYCIIDPHMMPIHCQAVQQEHRDISQWPEDILARHEQSTWQALTDHLESMQQAQRSCSWPSVWSLTNIHDMRVHTNC